MTHEVLTIHSHLIYGVKGTRTARMMTPSINFPLHVGGASNTEAKVITWNGITCRMKRGRNRGWMWCKEDILGIENERRAKGGKMDWTWENNEEWNTVQQNVISQTVVWGALLPFHWDCYYRWISPTKTSIPRVQHFLDSAVIEAGFENLALKADRVSAPIRQLWHWDEGWM